MQMETRKYEAEVKEVFSGDDLILMIDLGVDNLHKRARVRLHGVDTPSAIRAGADTEAGKVRAYVRNLIRDKRVTLTVVSRAENSWVGIIEYEVSGTLFNLNDDLMAQGFKFKREKAT